MIAQLNLRILYTQLSYTQFYVLANKNLDAMYHSSTIHFIIRISDLDKDSSSGRLILWIGKHFFFISTNYLKVKLLWQWFRVERFIYGSTRFVIPTQNRL